jgi:hypothetical protein
MKPLHGSPIVPFPGTGIGEFSFAFDKAGQVQQGQHCIVYLVGVRLHKTLRARPFAAWWAAEQRQADA